MQVGQAAYSIGQLARLSGLPVKTIRFYSDAGLLPPSARTDAGHRRYDEADLARLQLIRSLRELDVDLPAIRRVFEARSGLAELLATHAAALQARIRALQRQLAVVRAAADAPSEATIRRSLALARLDAIEFRALLEDFWNRATEGSPLDPAELEPMRRAGMPDLPDEPTPEQLDAWLELAELASDADFVRSLREMGQWMADSAPGGRIDARQLQAESAAAMAEAAALRQAGIGPDRPEAKRALRRLVRAYAGLLGRRDSRAFRRWLLERLEAMHDPRSERYWQLVAIIRAGEWPEPDRPRVPADAFRWLMDALRHDVGVATA
jgi:DNA-binding transcriptional MerR regulator